MKIAAIGAKGIPPKQGGIEYTCAEIYPRMIEKGHTVDLFSRCSYTDLPVFYKHDFQGVSITNLPCINRAGIDAFTSSLLGTIIACQEEYDILHFHALGPALFTWLPKISRNNKVVVTCHGLDWQRAKWGRFSSHMIRLGEKAAVKYADEIIVVSDTLRLYFRKTYQRETVLIPNAPATYTDSDPDFNFCKSLNLTPQKYIVYLGRLVPEKCADLLIQSFQSLNTEDWKLVLVGGSSDSSSFLNTLNQLADKQPNIIFAGELRGRQLAEIVRGAGLFALPSNIEGLPLAMLEAMQEKIPIIASDILPHRELLGADRGLMFKAGSISSCTDSLRWAIQNPKNMQKKAARAQEHIQNRYSWDRIVDSTLDVFESLTHKSASSMQNRPVQQLSGAEKS